MTFGPKELEIRALDSTRFNIMEGGRLYFSNDFCNDAVNNVTCVQKVCD